MKKILISLSIVAVVAAIAIGATTAFFSDTETSTGNTFTAGAIDLKIDSKATYNGQQVGAATWELKDLVPTADKFFNFSDVKPGDKGENTISLHVTNNDAWGCVNIIPTKNDDVSSNEPELAAGDTPNTDSIFDGELAQNMQFKIWADTCSRENTGQSATPGDNIFQEGCDRLLTQGTGPITPTTYALATPAGNNVFNGQTKSPLTGSSTYFLGVEWSIPTIVGNIIQTDNYQADVSFYVEQSRNNSNFVCPNAAPTPRTLRLENEIIVENGPWTVINDQTYADLTWSDGPTFAYTLNGQGLAASTQYSLIYYADGWPGNNPGAYIGSGTTNSSGVIAFSGSPELGMDLPKLPDGNFAVGAKIWLVRSSDYNGGSLSTGPMTAWNPSQYLFEGNVYIHYDDTNSPL